MNTHVFECILTWVKQRSPEEVTYKMNIPKRDKNIQVKAKPNNLTTEEAFAIIFKQYKQALKELSQK